MSSLQNKVRELFLGKNVLAKENVIAQCQQPLESAAVHHHIYDFLATAADHTTHHPPAEASLLHDLEIFHAYDHSTHGTLIENIDQETRLRASSFYTHKLFAHPCLSVSHLQNRQRLLSSLFQKRDVIDPLFTILASHEESLAWLIDNKSQCPDQNGLQDMAFLQGHLLNWLNQHGTILTSYNVYRIIVSPLIGLLTPTLYVVLPYLVLRFYFGIKWPFSSFVKLYVSMLFQNSPLDAFLGSSFSRFQRFSLILSILFYFQGLFNSFEISRLVYKATDVICHHTRRVVAFIQTAERILLACQDEEALYADGKSEFPWVLNNLTTRVPSPLYAADIYLRTFGDVLSLYHCFDMAELLPLLQRVYMLDALAGIARWSFASPMPRTAVRYLIENETQPRVRARKLYHPCLSSSRIVTNDVDVDASRNMLITGPNAGGKSTLIKSVVMAVYLAHTIGFAPCEEMDMTPFAYINTQITVPDIKGVSSLFEAEMRSAKYHLDKIKELSGSPGRFAFVAMDEVFNSTNPIEGISAAYAVAHTLGQHPQTACIITTHYHYLCGLEKEPEKPFVNFKMDVTQDPVDGRVISFEYKLNRGISRQFVALELLKRDGFEDEFIQYALAVKERLVCPRSLSSKQQT